MVYEQLFLVLYSFKDRLQAHFFFIDRSALNGPIPGYSATFFCHTLTLQKPIKYIYCVLCTCLQKMMYVAFDGNKKV